MNIIIFAFLSVFQANTAFGNSYKCNPGASDNLVGSSVCAFTTETYTAEFTPLGKCKFRYTWTIEGGEFSSNSESELSGKDLHSVDVIWYVNADCHKISYTATNALAPGDSGIGEELCKGEEMVVEEGYLYPILTGNANQPPDLSKLSFNGQGESMSLLCSDDGAFSVIEHMPDSDFDIETKLSYVDSNGDEVVLKDWSSKIPKDTIPFEFTPTYEDLHARIKFLKQSRYGDCNSITNAYEKEIDFYKRPDLKLVSETQSQCKGESAVFEYRFLEGDISSVVINLMNQVTDFNQTFQILTSEDNTFTIYDGILIDAYDPTKEENTKSNLVLEPGNYSMTIEPQVLAENRNENGDFPCADVVKIEVEEPPVDSIILNTSDSTIACSTDKATISFQMQREDKPAATFDYRLFDVDEDEPVEKNGVSDSVNFSVGLGNFYIEGKESGCEWDTDAVLESNHVNIVTHSITFQDGPKANKVKTNGFHILCYGYNTASITVKAKDALSGNLDYLLKKKNDGSWDDYDTLLNEKNKKQVVFEDLPEGKYKVKVKYNRCDNWEIRDGEVIESDVVSITAPELITVDNTPTLTRPKCAVGSVGSFTFEADGGNGGPYEITDAEISNNQDGQNDLFSKMTINGLATGAVVESITVKDTLGCSEQIDIQDQTMPPAENPLQFTYQKRIQPKCYNSNGIFEFIYDNDRYIDENNSIKIYVVEANDSCLDARHCSQTNNKIDDSIVSLDAEGDTLKVLVDSSAIVNGNAFKVYIEDDYCTIISETTISFTKKFRPTFSPPSSKRIPCKFGSMDVRLPMNHNQGSFDLKLERKPSGEAKFKEADLDTVQMYRNSDNELVIRNLYEGDYKLSGTDGKGCSFEDFEFTLNEPDELLELTASPHTKFSADGTDYHISEYGVADGKIDFEAEGGEFNYIFYLYKNSQFQKSKTTNNEGSFDSLKALDDDGNPNEYYIGVRDSRNCFKRSETFTLTQPDSLIFTYLLNNYISSENDTFNIKCNGGTDEIRVTTQGGVYPHLVEVYKGGQYERKDSVYSETDTIVFSNLLQDSFKIEVTDKYKIDGVTENLRTSIDDSTVLIEPTPLSVDTNLTQPICYGDSTGSITITPSGGVPFANGEYDIHIFDQNGDSILNDITDELSIVADSGIYFYTIFDAFNCEYESEDEYYTGLGNKITVTELSPRLTVVKDTITYPPCAGDETATLSVNASGGRPDDGSYILELYDNNVPPLYGPNALIDSVSTVESGNYTFQNLFAGDYTVIAYDDSLCSEMIPITIEERDYPLEFKIVDSVLARCPNSSDAKLKIISTGGDSPHIFSLNNIDFSPSDSITYSDDSTETYYHKTFTGLIGDSTYNIYLKDDNYYDGSFNNVCLIDTSQIIPKTPSLALSFEKTDIKCFGEENGDFTLSPSYGDKNNINDFTIEINGPNGVVSHDQGYVNNLSAGRYKIKITLADTTACKTPLFDKIDIDQPEPLVVDIFSNTEYNCSSDEEIILNGEINGGLSTSDQFLYAINSDNSADFELLEVSKSEFRIKEKLEPGWNVFFLKSSPYNCMVSDSFFVESEQPNLQIIANQAASCFGKSDGEIRVTSNFEKLNFKLMNDEDTFSIDDSEADTVVFEGLEAGIYQLTGRNSSCLADTLEVIVNEPDSIIIQPELVEKPTCNKANGIGTMNITGGTAPYEILWQTENGNILDSTSLKSGYYDILVEDANNCSAIFKDFLVEELNDFTVSVQTSSNPTCGKDNGSILIQPNEGIPPYEIIWFKDGSKLLHDTDSLTGLSEGSYIFSVTDAMGCIFEDSVKLTAIDPINIGISDEVAANCDTQNGSVTLSVSGGTPPYTYSWSDSIPNTEGNYAEGLWGGEIYTVSVIDANLCSKDYEFSIGNIGAPEVAVHTTRPKCGLANGRIEIELLSENDASYEWKEFENTNSTLDSIPSGIYFVTVSANDCPITKRIELTEDINNPLSVNPIDSNASCNDNGGEIDLNISGGTPPYAITWDDTPLDDSIRTGLSSGNYSFVVTDSIGCTASGDIYLDKEELLQLSLNSLGNAVCGETNGYIQLDSLSSDYTFNWSHNDLLDDHLAENLSSGLYSVYAVNAAGCSTDTVSYYISSSNTDLRIQEVSVISASCNESTDGSLEVNAVNGVPPYQYEWDDEDQQTGNIAQGLRPGTYTVRVTDATNCSRVKSLTLGQVNPVYISNISKNAPSCTDAMDGSIAITASGGKGNYSYEWSTGDTTSTISGLESGEYSVTVYDNFVCSDQARITITAPDTLSAEYLTEKPNCYTTADGQVEISISGGIPPYNVEWEDGSTLKRRFDLGAGNYEVFISDNNNCSLIKNINVPAKDSVNIDYEISSVSCNGGNDGSIRIKSISNANSPKVEWSNGQIGNTLRNVSAGFYEANVTDSYGCVTSFEFEVGSPDPLQVVNETITDVLCKNGFNGSIAFDVIGGNGNYNFNWDDGPRIKNRFNLTAGNYKVTVSDDLNCTIERQFSISEPDLLVLDYNASSVSCFGSADGFASISIEGGVSPYQISWTDGASDSIRNDLAAGTHDVLVTDANNCSESIEVIIPNLNPIRINEVIQTIPSCYQGSDGGLELDISGGVAPYSVSWSNGKTGAFIESISAGNYRVTITDDNNCQLTELISLGDGTPIYLTSLVTANPICYGEPSGMVEVVPNGGNPPFEVLWADGTTATRRDDLLAGSHTFDVVDATGCSVSYEINLQDPPLEEIEGLPSEVFLCTGGVANLDAGEWNSYSWTADNGFTSKEREVSIDAEGNYNLTVTNQEGCEDNHQFTVTKDDNILTADFLLTTEAVVQDTVIIVDVSWRVPDSVRWINPDDPDFYLVSQTEEYQEVIFTRTGEFELNMKAKLDFCEANVSKTITVLSREEAARLSDEANKNISNDLHVSTSIYPNPNHGDFRIEMKGNKEYDHHSKIIDVNTGIEYYRFSGKKQMNYVFNIGDNRLPDGVYLLMLETEGKTITKRFIVK